MLCNCVVEENQVRSNLVFYIPHSRLPSRSFLQYCHSLPSPLNSPHYFHKSRILPSQHNTTKTPTKSKTKQLTPTTSYLIHQEIIYLCITASSYPRKLAFTYLSDLSTEFSTTYPSHTLLAPTLRPYAFMEFDTFINRTKGTYSDTRATQNLDKLNDELRDVTKVMTKNIEDLLYRGDSLERMGEVSSRLREDSKKYRKAAVRINWELLLKQYGPLGGLGLFVVLFLWWRFFW